MRVVELTQSFSAVTSAEQGASFDVSEAKSISVQCDATETSSGSLTVTIQKSNDGITWTNAVTPVAISADETVWVEDDNPNYAFARIAFAISSGTMNTADCHILAKD